jgi:exosortase D (VPLPA-CTERM-specific)
MTMPTIKNTLLAGLMALSFMVGFISAIKNLNIQWDNGDNSYCYLIIPLFIYLCWEKKDNFRFDEYEWNPWGGFPVLLSIMLIFFGELGSVEALIHIGMVGCIISVMYIIYGSRLLHLWFPLLILAFIIPLPPFVNRIVTFHLKLAASSMSVSMLRIFGVSVLQDGNIIDLGFTQLQVVDACSGLRYLMPLILMGLLFGYFYCRRWWQNALLLIAVIPLSIVVNAIRIFFTGMLHVWGYPELAEDFFHDFSGWIVFILAGAILFGLCLMLKWIGERRKTRSPGLTLNRERSGPEYESSTLKRENGWGMQVAITVALCLLFVGSGYALQRLPTTANMPDRASFDNFPMAIDEWRARRHYLPQEVLDNLWSDDYVSATFVNRDRRHAIHLMIPFYEYQGARHTAHAPQSCMLGGGWALSNSTERLVHSADGTQFPIMTSIWEKGDRRILGTYFFFQRGRTITSPWMNKYWLMVDAFTRQRTDGALVRAEMPLDSNQSIEDAYRIVEGFLGQVYDILPEFVPL